VVPDEYYQSKKNNLTKADIAILVLKHPATFSEIVQPACLPQLQRHTQLQSGIVSLLKYIQLSRNVTSTAFIVCFWDTQNNHFYTTIQNYKLYRL
jgi:hypothetical protein